MNNIFFALNREIEHRSVRVFIESDLLKIEIGLWGDIPELAAEFGPEEAYGWISARNYIFSLKHRSLEECTQRMLNRKLLSTTEVAAIESRVALKLLTNSK